MVASTGGERERADILEVIEWDWVETWHGRVLHHAAEVHDEFEFDFDHNGEVTTTCGRRLWAGIPGLFSRMGAPRCKRCCAKLGWPQGEGSPKNDDALRPLVEAKLRAARRTHDKGET